MGQILKRRRQRLEMRRAQPRAKLADACARTRAEPLPPLEGRPAEREGVVEPTRVLLRQPLEQPGHRLAVGFRHPRRRPPQQLRRLVPRLWPAAQQRQGRRQPVAGGERACGHRQRHLPDRRARHGRVGLGRRARRAAKLGHAQVDQLEPGRRQLAAAVGCLGQKPFQRLPGLSQHARRLVPPCSQQLNRHVGPQLAQLGALGCVRLLAGQLVDLRPHLLHRLDGPAEPLPRQALLQPMPEHPDVMRQVGRRQLLRVLATDLHRRQHVRPRRRKVALRTHGRRRPRVDREQAARRRQLHLRLQLLALVLVGRLRRAPHLAAQHAQHQPAAAHQVIPHIGPVSRRRREATIPRPQEPADCATQPEATQRLLHNQRLLERREQLARFRQELELRQLGQTSAGRQRQRPSAAVRPTGQPVQHQKRAQAQLQQQLLVTVGVRPSVLAAGAALRDRPPRPPARLGVAPFGGTDQKHPQPWLMRSLAPRAQPAVGRRKQLLRRVPQLLPPAQLHQALPPAALRQLRRLWRHPVVRQGAQRTLVQLESSL
eukprot:scaffold17682_cov113-Isochrysis_galbana.AAC.12